MKNVQEGQRNGQIHSNEYPQPSKQYKEIIGRGTKEK